MAYLNAQEREQLRQNLLNMSYNEAKDRLWSIDPRGRLAYWRNVQRVGEWDTRFVLDGLGVCVSLVEVEHKRPTDEDGISRRSFEMVDVRVEPTDDNKL